MLKTRVWRAFPDQAGSTLAETALVLQNRGSPDFAPGLARPDTAGEGLQEPVASHS